MLFRFKKKASKRIEKYYLCIFAIYSALVPAHAGATEFNRDNIFEYHDEVTPPSGSSEVQIGGNREYTFLKGGSLGRIWIPYENSNITFKIAAGETLTTSSSTSDGLEVSSGAQLSIYGGNFSSINNSPYTEDSAINIRSNGKFTADVDNFTAISGKEASLKLMSDEDQSVTANIHASESINLLSGGTGLAMEASAGGGSVSASITAKNITIKSSEENAFPRLGGIYLLAYYPSSKTLDLTMSAEDNFLVQGQKYGLAGWGDTNVMLTGKDISISASHEKDYAGKGIYLDSHNKNMAEGRGVTIHAANSLSVDGYYGLRMFGEAGLELSGRQVSISGEYAAPYLSEQSGASITADAIRMQGENYTALVYDSAVLDMKADEVEFNALGSPTSYAAYVSGEHATLSIEGKTDKYAKVLANGYIKALKGGTVDMFMGKDSVYSGYTFIDEGKISLNFEDNARWNVVKNSSLSSLNF